ncbi:MAG: ABC transporter ATP-binding protein [Crocinitomicaceae bacterium]|nr:ABC transporter ATP-binding protein [Crocinitomicaceae bacterium]
MKSILEIYKLTFSYKVKAILVIIFNLLYVIFNLISLVLFIPFLQLIFPKEENVVASELIKPEMKEGIANFFNYCAELYQYTMQTMVAHDAKQALLLVCISVLLAFFFKNLFRYFAIYHQSQLRMAVVRDLRDQMFDKAMRLPLAFYSEEKKGDLMARMNSDVGEIEIAVVSMLELIFREPIAIIINLAALIYWSPQLTIISFVLLPISAFVISRIGKSLKKTASEGQKQMGVLFSSMEENLGGIRIIKAFNAIPYVSNSFKKINLRHQQLITSTFRKKDLSGPLNEFLGAAVMLGIVWFGGSMILEAKADSGMTGEKFIGFILVFSQLLRPIQGIASSIANLNKAKASQDRISEIINADEHIYEAENPVALPPLSKGITYKNISFKYKDALVLKNINLFIPYGKTVALVGESGSGKSTIADLMPRFYDVQEGEILFDETPIKNITITDLRNQIGMVTQESILFNDSIRNNIAFGMTDKTDEEIMNAAKVANAHEFIVRMDEGYETNIGERGNKLSGGQKQRLSIARAVLKNSPILILDEATSALDTESEKLVQDALEKLMKDRTSLIIAHRLSTIRNADIIVVLNKGEIVEQGSHEELLNKRGAYYNLCNLQGLE